MVSAALQLATGGQYLLLRLDRELADDMPKMYRLDLRCLYPVPEAKYMRQRLVRSRIDWC
jgi:hypothetical protein